MERQAYWYSIIQFQPDVIRGEKINVGMILHSIEDGKISYKLLDEDNVKVRSFLSDTALSRVYRIQRDFVCHLFEHLTDNGLNMVGNVQAPDPKDEQFIKNLTDVMPSTFFLSEPTFALTSNAHELFMTVLRRYIGEQFLRADDKPISTKAYVKRVFEEHNWLGSKIHSNVRLRPVQELPHIRFQVDFVFKNGIWNLIQTVPERSDLNQWFARTHTLVDTYTKDVHFYIVRQANPTVTAATEMVHYLTKQDSRVLDIEIGTKSFSDFYKKVETEAKDISDFDGDLSA